MKLLNSFKHGYTDFGAKIFSLFTVLILVTYISLASLFVLYESRSFKDNLITEGRQLANLFAYSARLGIFAESEDMLKDPIEGIMKQKEVIMVQAFTEDGRLLIETVSSGNHVHNDREDLHLKDPEKIIDTVRSSALSYYYEGPDEIEFWAPVFSRGKTADEDLFFSERPADTGSKVIGFTRIVFTTSLMNEQLNTLMLNSVIIPVIFLLPGWVLIFFIVRGITRPLNRLTEGVVSLGKGGPVKMVNVDTKDEISKLARAFNNMVISLRKKETEKRHVEEQLRQSQKMEAIGTLAGGIAHDFNNVLSVIAGYASLMKRTAELDDNSKQYIDHLLSTAERASSLIKNLLAFSKQQPVELSPITINSTITKIEKNISRLLGEEIEFRVILTEKDVSVLSDTGQIEQILINLAINARDAMPAGGTLTISTESAAIEKQFPISSGYVPPGQYVLISVEDTGSGMDSLTIERMFDPFFTTKKAGKGTGLGLSMVYGIIKQHNGYIDVISKPGRGTTFRIYLHAGTAETEKEERPAALETAPGGTETILVAEDRSDVRTLTTHILKEAGYQVIEAAEGEDTVAMFMKNKDRIDFLLLDAVMPKKSGMDAYKEIRKIRPDIKALFMSGHARKTINTEVHASLEGQVNFLSKPVMPDRLLTKIREILDN